jgi:hypothetical protein
MNSYLLLGVAAFVWAVRRRGVRRLAVREPPSAATQRQVPVTVRAGVPPLPPLQGHRRAGYDSTAASSTTRPTQPSGHPASHG